MDQDINSWEKTIASALVLFQVLKVNGCTAKRSRSASFVSDLSFKGKYLPSHQGENSYENVYCTQERCYLK